MVWGRRSEEKLGEKAEPITQPITQPVAAKEDKMTEKMKSAKQLTISAANLEGVADELKRFSRKLEELLALVKATNPPVFKSGHAAIMAVRRASQDVSFEMKKLRTLLSTGE